MARAAAAVFADDSDSYILTAGGPLPSNGLVTLAVGAVGTAIPIPQGTVLVDAANRQFVTNTPFTVPIDAGPAVYTLSAQSLRVGRQTGLPAGAPLAWALGSPAALVAATASLVVPADWTPGNPAALDLLGRGRGVYRQSGEPDTAYRLRIRRLTEVVTPAAIIDTANQVLKPLGVTVVFEEELGPGFQIDTWLALTTISPDVPAGQIVKPTVANGYYYLCTTGGIAGLAEPEWFQDPGSESVDGTVVWTCQGVDYSAFMFQDVTMVDGARVPRVGFYDADPPPPAGTAPGTISTWGAVGRWYYDQGLGPALHGAGSLGPANNSLSTFRGFFRLHIPWITGDPGQPFCFFDAYPFPPAGFYDQSFYGSGREPTPTDKAAGQVYAAILPIKLGGVRFEVVVP